MRVKVLANLGDDWPEPWLDGEEHDCGEDLGRSLIAKGLAVQVPDSAEEQATKVANQKPKNAPVPPPPAQTPAKTFGHDPHEGDRLKQQAAKEAPAKPTSPPHDPEVTKQLGKGKGHSGHEPK